MGKVTRPAVNVEALLESYAAELARRGMQPYNANQRLSLLRSVARWVAPRGLLGATRVDVDGWLDAKDHIRRSTRARYAEMVEAFFSWAGRPLAARPRSWYPAPETLRLPAVTDPLGMLAAGYVTARYDQGLFRASTARSVFYSIAGFARHAAAPPTRSDVEWWLGAVPGAPATKRGRLSRLRSFFEWCVLEGHYDRDPTVGVRGPKQPRHVPRGLRSGQIAALLDRCPDRRARVVCLLAVQEGLRVREIATLQIGDVDMEGATVLVHGKGGHERILPLSEETRRAVAAYLDEHPATAGPLVRSYTDPSRPITASYVSKLVSDWLRAAGVKQQPGDGRSAHSLRHTMAGDMVRRGVNLRDVQAALGHASITTTQVYLPYFVGDLRSAMGGRKYAGARDDGE